MYEMNGRIRYSEVGYKKELTPVGLVNYFQDCSTFQSEDVGLGLEYFKELKRVWLLSGWQIDIRRMPLLGEEITVATWPYGFKGFIGYRNYTMTDINGEILAAANAIWTLVDLEKRVPVRVTQREIQGYQIMDPFDMEYLPRKVKVSGEEQKRSPILIGKERIDTNGHMNNGQYISLAEEFVPDDIFFDRIRVEYKKEVKYKDKVLPVIYNAKKSVTVVLENENGTVYAVVEFGQQ